MAAKVKKEKKPAAKATPAGDTTDNTSEEATSMPSTAQIIGLMAKAALMKASVTGLRPVLPVIDGYGRSRPVVDGRVPEIQKGGPDEFSPDEVAVLKSAGEKFAYEFIELASRSHPVDDKTGPYVAKINDKTRQYPAPSLSNLVSAVVYAQRLLGLADDPQEDLPPPPDDGVDEPDTEISSGRVVVLNAVGPGEYVPKVGAIKPNEIRRIAMSQRQVSQSQTRRSAAASYSNPVSPGEAYAKPVSPKESFAQQAATRTPAASSKCGCHGSGASASESVARYKADGSCASPGKISCETTWRLRECVKTTLCDLLICVSSKMCKDGKFTIPQSKDLVDCLGQSVCSLLECIPNAVCPPKQACPEKPRVCQPCNFAVEEEL